MHDALFRMVGTNIHRVLMFAWFYYSALIDTYIHRVLVINVYLYSRVYGILAVSDSWIEHDACQTKLIESVIIPLLVHTTWPLLCYKQRTQPYTVQFIHTC